MIICTIIMMNKVLTFKKILQLSIKDWKTNKRIKLKNVQRLEIKEKVINVKPIDISNRMRVKNTKKRQARINPLKVIID